MRQVKAIPITHENFAPFGQFYTMADPKGYALCGEIHKFFPDRLTASANHNVGYSPILVKKPERMIISAVEYHTTTWEMIMPLNDDMVLHVAPRIGRNARSRLGAGVYSSKEYSCQDKCRDMASCASSEKRGRTLRDDNPAGMYLRK